jgi:tetratricopeptide (TPR) repeat protein
LGRPIRKHVRTPLLRLPEVSLHQLISDFEAQDSALDHGVMIMESGIDPRVFNFVYQVSGAGEVVGCAFQKALQLELDYVDAHEGLGWVYAEKKMYREAIAELEKSVNLSNRHELCVASLGKVLGNSGRKQEARKLLQELEGRSKHRYISPCLIALVQIGLGEKDQAIASLEQGYTDRDQWMLYLKVDPHMDDLRSDPRFQDLLRRVGFPQ